MEVVVAVSRSGSHTFAGPNEPAIRFQAGLGVVALELPPRPHRPLAPV